MNNLYINMKNILKIARSNNSVRRNAFIIRFAEHMISCYNVIKIENGNFTQRIRPETL